VASTVDSLLSVPTQAGSRRHQGGVVRSQEACVVAVSLAGVCAVVVVVLSAVSAGSLTIDLSADAR